LVVFDALEIDGVWIASLPLEARLNELNKGVRECDRIKRAEEFPDFKTAWHEVLTRNLEGVVAKRRGSPYEARRSSDWVKLKNWWFVEHDFREYETHNKGITLDDGQHRVSVSGDKCRECLLALEGGGRVRVKVRYLVGYEKGWRQPTIAEVLG
jgi:hypothetical protein